MLCGLLLGWLIALVSMCNLNWSSLYACVAKLPQRQTGLQVSGQACYILSVTDMSNTMPATMWFKFGSCIAAVQPLFQFHVL